MKWRGRRGSSHIEDRRGARGRTGLVGGGIGTIVILLIALVLGVDPSALMQAGDAVAPEEQAAPLPPGADSLSQFVSVVLADTEETWSTIFAERGQDYPEPTLVLFSDAVRSACGSAPAAVGPFYCPTDQKVYIDLSFYRDLQTRFGAPGDFAQAYVIAHEVGHHVQTVLGISSQVDAERQRAGEREANSLSVMQELQADCFAGIWAHHAQRARDLLDRGDVEEALTAAAAIGDDRLQRQAGGEVVPESFTHGTSEQRARWFRAGLDAGALDRCDTFSATRL